MKRVGILHEDLEWGEKRLKALLEKRHVSVCLFDVRKLSFPLEKRLLDCTLVLNRVYPSVANRSYENVKKAMKVVRALEAAGVRVVNSSRASRADYSKYWACEFLGKKGILVPKTFVVKPKTKQGPALARIGFPAVIKRDCAGRAFDLAIVFNLAQAKKEVERRLNDPAYSGNTIVQEFIRSVNDYDLKVCIAGGETLVSAYKRTLISHSRGKRKWAGIISRGSKIVPFDEVPEKLLDTALGASKALGADINDMDIVEGKKGFYVIENNLTPGFNSKNEETKVYKKPEKIVDYIYRKYLEG